MGFNFPDAPTPGQVFGNYTWDAATGAWKLTGGGGSGGGGSITISDTPPASPVAGALWWESDTGNLYIRYNDGDSSQWVLAVPAMSASSIGAVAYTPQTLTAPQQTIARQNIYAAPFDAMAYSGMQINGSMEVSQELGNATTTVNGTHVCDGWKFFTSNSGFASQATRVQLPGFIAGLVNLIQLQTTSAKATLAAGDYTFIAQSIEGVRVSRLGWGALGTSPITIGFWSAHTLTGLYSGSVRNNTTGTGTRSYVFTYTHAASNVPQFNVVTIPADTGVTWATDNNVGMVIAFAMGEGGTFTTSSVNTWLAGNFVAAAGQVNGVNSTSNFFRITGVVVLPGIEAPSAARSPLIMRPFDQELVTCQRYFRVITPQGAGAAADATKVYYWINHNGMRSAPAVAMTAAAAIGDMVGAAITQSAPNIAIYNNDADAGSYVLGNFAGLTTFRPLMFVNSTAGKIKLDARL